MLDLGGGVGLEDLGGHAVGIFFGGADLHEAGARVVDEQVAESAFLVLVVGDGRDAGQVQRIVLLSAVDDGVVFVVEGIGGKFELREEKCPQDQVREQTEQVALLGEDDIEHEAHHPEDPDCDAGPFDPLRMLGIPIDDFHALKIAFFS